MVASTALAKRVFFNMGLLPFRSDIAVVSAFEVKGPASRAVGPPAEQLTP
jgi:hypothetical protein